MHIGLLYNIYVAKKRSIKNCLKCIHIKIIISNIAFEIEALYLTT